MQTMSFKTALQDIKQQTRSNSKDDPFVVLQELVKDINETFPGKLDAQIGFGEDPKTGQILEYNFYLIAAIGNGYVYQLFTLKTSQDSVVPFGYPLTISTSFTPEYQLKLDEAKNEKELRIKIGEILQRPFVKDLIQNLIIQIDLHKRAKSAK